MRAGAFAVGVLEAKRFELLVKGATLRQQAVLGAAGEEELRLDSTRGGFFREGEEVRAGAFHLELAPEDALHFHPCEERALAACFAAAAHDIERAGKAGGSGEFL